MGFVVALATHMQDPEDRSQRIEARGYEAALFPRDLAVK